MEKEKQSNKKYRVNCPLDRDTYDKVRSHLLDTNTKMGEFTSDAVKKRIEELEEMGIEE